MYEEKTADRIKRLHSVCENKVIRRKRTLSVCVLAVAVITTVSVAGTVFLSNWQIAYGTATMFLTPTSEMQGELRIFMRGYFNSSVGSIKIYPSIPFVRKESDTSQIILELDRIAARQTIRISVDTICVTQTNASMNFPFDSDGLSESHVMLYPGNINATVINNSAIVATSPFGDRKILTVSYAVEYKNGSGNYVGYPYHWHDMFRTQDLFAVLFASISLLCFGVICRLSGFDVRRYPFATLFIVSISLVVCLSFGTAYSLVYGQYDVASSALILFMLRPFFHNSYSHLANNLALLLPLGVVLESGLPWKSLKIKLMLTLPLVLASSWIRSYFWEGLELGYHFWLFGLEFCMQPLSAHIELTY